MRTVSEKLPAAGAVCDEVDHQHQEQTADAHLAAPDWNATHSSTHTREATGPPKASAAVAALVINLARIEVGVVIKFHGGTPRKNERGEPTGILAIVS